MRRPDFEYALGVLKWPAIAISVAATLAIAETASSAANPFDVSFNCAPAHTHQGVNLPPHVDMTIKLDRPLVDKFMWVRFVDRENDDYAYIGALDPTPPDIPDDMSWIKGEFHGRVRPVTDPRASMSIKPNHRYGVEVYRGGIGYVYIDSREALWNGATPNCPT